MSRIGKKPIEIPAKVKLTINADGGVVAEGPKGKLEWKLPKEIKGSINSNVLSLERTSEERRVRALHGLSRALVNNMLTGVSNGFTRDLEIQGVGFKAAVQGPILNLSLGFSHPVLFPIPDGIKITAVTAGQITTVKVEGIDKHLVGQVAADIRAYYPPEPYKGKGVRYVGEQVQRKEGKTVQ